jgi:hypothetical protein
MKKRIKRVAKEVETVEEPYNPAEDYVEGETLDTYMLRKDEEEGRKHDANESRHRASRTLDDYDPHLGSN